MPTPLPHKQIIKKRTLKFPRYQSDEQIKVKSSWRRGKQCQHCGFACLSIDREVMIAY